jgi:hypothetical protein
LVSFSCAATLGAALVGRLGTTDARLGAAGGLGALVVALTARALWLRGRRRDPEATVHDTIARVDPTLASAALRAMRLVKRTKERADEAGSTELADLHFKRLVQRAPADRLEQRARRVGSAWSIAGLALAAVSLLAVTLEPLRFIEGFDVLAAHKGDAPLPIAWLDEVEIVATPPEYLHQPAGAIEPFYGTSQPRGTTLQVRGRPLRRGRALVLTDGNTRVDFQDDGSGAVVARWTLTESTSLFIGARFGDVTVRQADAQAVISIPDEAPHITVEGAPRTVKLLEEPSVPVHWEATDDHGLREVNLVLRAGSREERRVLSKPASDATVDRGGYELRANDAFFKRVYVPVEVTVEARDNDTVAGPKWGKSAAIIVVPPQVGEAEALRYEALVRARDALVDLVASRMDIDAELALSKTPKLGAEHATREEALNAAAFEAMQAALAGSYGGLGIKGKSAKLARGQLRRLRDALDAEREKGTKDAHETLLEETKAVTLAVDIGLRSLGVRDTRAVAKKLADVADEVANAAVTARQNAEAKGVEARMAAAISVLDGGGKQLLRLGDLGLDIGEIVANDLKRIERARAAKDLLHTELAARDLAARLRKPDPSFGGGGKGGMGGVESGGGQPSSPSESSSDADAEQEKTEQELDKLSQEHSQARDETSDLLDKSQSDEELEAMKEELHMHADSIRDSVKGLPRPEGDPGSAQGAAGAGRESAESMANKLEKGALKDAVGAGKDAQQSLGDAQKKAKEQEGFFPEERIAREAEKAKEKIDRELAFAEELLKKMRKKAAERAKKELEKSGKNESKLAERAKDLAQKGQRGEGSMPEEQLDLLQQAEQKMREAERSLHDGDGETGLQNQEDAQRLLEMARGEHGDEPKEDQDGKAMSRKAEIPDKDAHKGPEEFRKRVLKGLSGSSDPALRDAVKRYAEGLLK